MVSVGEVFGVMDLIAATASGFVDEVTAVMRKRFCAETRTSVTDLEAELSVDEVIDGLRAATSAVSLGLWVDHNEPATINDQAQRSIEAHVGVANPGAAVYYTYDGNDVAGGLLGFDTWLQANQRTNLGLVQVATGADYFLSILHPHGDIDQLVEALEHIGIEARFQSIEPWPGSSTVAHYNVGEHIEQHLITKHGFEWIDNQLVQPIDDQHSIVARFSLFERGPTKGHGTSLEFGLSRRDINRAIREATKLTSPDHTPLNLNPYKLVEGFPPRVLSSLHDSKDDIVQLLDEWLSELGAIANLACIANRLESAHADVDEQSDPDLKTSTQLNWTNYAFNIALSGWEPQLHDHLFDVYRATFSAYKPDAPIRQAAEERISQLQAWIANNPNGLR